MKGILRYLLPCLVLLIVTAGCSKQPVQEIEAARAAVDSAISEGAEKYSPVETKKVNDALSAAMSEVKTQDGKFLKDYKNAREMLAKVKTEADAVKAGLAAKKETAKNDATLAGAAAGAAVEETKALLTKAAKGKGAKADVEALGPDIKGLEDSFAEVQKLIQSADYTAAVDKANVLKTRAAEVAEKIKQAQEKAPAKKDVKKEAKKEPKKK